jgi:ankyrin repeat protein
MLDRRLPGEPRPNVFVALGLTTLLITLPGGPPDSPVADAAQRGHIEEVRSLLRNGADVNAAQGDGMTALHWAALNDDAPMTEALVYAGGNLESTTRLGRYTPLHLAAKEARIVAMQTLLDAGANVDAVTETGVRPIHFAAEAGRVEGLKLLIDHRADVNVREAYSGRTPLMFATAANRLTAMELLILSGADVSLASEVVDYTKREEQDDIERQRRERVIAAARDPEPEDQTPDRSATPDTSAAAVPDSTKAVPDSSANQEPEGQRPRRERAERRTAGQPDPDSPTPTPTDTSSAKPDSAPRPLSYTDLVGKQGGLTPLHYAVRDGRDEAARLLLAAGADINGVTKGDQTSPLLMAVINGNYDLALYLLENGADPNLASDDGAAPLFATVNQEWHLRTWYPQPTAQQQQKTTHLELMRALLEAGADPDKRLDNHIWYAAYNAGRMGVDFGGATAFWRAAYAMDVDAMRLLVEYGADPNIPTTKPPSRRRGFPGSGQDTTEAEEDPSGLPEVPAGGPAVHPLHAASGVGYGTSRVGQQHRYVPNGWLTSVQYLIGELGVDVNVRDHDGYSAVHNAAARGDNEVIEYLVSMGADVTFLSRRGQTTVDMANGPQQRVQPFPETIALLERLGAKNNNNCQSCE